VTIAEIMTSNLHTIRNDAIMLEAEKLMKKLAIRHLPVVNEAGDIIGILSDRDVQRAVTVVNSETGRSNYIQNHKKVVDFMTTTIHTINETDSIESVIRDMIEIKVSCFLVRSKANEIAGIVTTDDFLLYLLDLLGEKRNPFNLKRFFK
jgi:acetoin utilization protein AcuB